MKKYLVILILSFSLGIQLISFITYASQTSVTNYYPSPSGNYTKLHLINQGSGGPNENYASGGVPACFCAESTNSFTQSAPNSGINSATSNCDAGGSTTGTPVSSGGTPATYTNAGVIFADPSSGFLEVCKIDGSVASFPGASFNRYCPGASSCAPAFGAVCAPTTNYTVVSSGAVIPGVLYSYTCAFNNNASTYAKSGCFSTFSSGVGSIPEPCSEAEPNAYDMNCQGISFTPGTPIYKRDCCFNSGPYALGTSSLCTCAPGHTISDYYGAPIGCS